MAPLGSQQGASNHDGSDSMGLNQPRLMDYEVSAGLIGLWRLMYRREWNLRLSPPDETELGHLRDRRPGVKTSGLPVECRQENFPQTLF